MVLSKPHGYYSLIIVSGAGVWDCQANASAVRHSNAGEERIRSMCGHPTVGGKQPLRSNADHGSYGKRHARGESGCCECRLYQLSDEASGLQYTGDNDGGIARSEDATCLSPRSPDGCLTRAYGRLSRPLAPRFLGVFILFKPHFAWTSRRLQRREQWLLTMRNDHV
jgi:hypothetical protein